MGSPWSQQRYLDAYHFAARAHLGQRYPGTEISYLMHLSFVSMEVIAALQHEGGHDGDLAVQCALLHDVLEDTDRQPAELRERFGSAVTCGVTALTKSAELPKAERMADSLQRIRQQPTVVWLVKMADRITNLQQPPSSWPRGKRLRYQQEAQIIHESLSDGSAYLSRRLADKIAGYERFILES